MSTMDWPTVKGFTDPSERDALMWARWGGSSFQTKQWRCYTTDPYDSDFEAAVRAETVGGRKCIDYWSCLAILDPSFPKKHPKAL